MIYIICYIITMVNSDNYISKIREILDKSGWTQAQFAQELGVTFATVSRWLNGHNKPHLSQVRQIERFHKNIIGIIPVTKQEIERIIQQLEIKRKQYPNIKKILLDDNTAEEFLLELTYNSDAIEGNTLTKKETETIIFNNGSIKDKSLIEHLEAVNHTVILKDIFSGKIGCPVDEELIKKTHKILMQGIRDDAGEYARHKRAVRGVDLILPSPEDIPEEMKLFLSKVNNFQRHPIEHITRMHADFEAIHPFGDGNGRIGRLIMIMQLIHCGFAPCIISVNEKAGYYESLEYAQKKSETHFVCFLTEAVLKGYELIGKRYKRYG